MKTIYNVSKKSKNVSKIVKKKFQNTVINNFIKNENTMSWTQEKEDRKGKIKDSWVIKKNN
jgi:hypothetical protein